MGIGVALGWYAWKEDIHITYICYWGLMCLVNGIMDLIKLIDHAVKSPVPLFSAHFPMKQNLISFAVLLAPLSLLAGAYLAYQMYRNAKDVDSGILPYSGQKPPQPTYTLFAG